MYYKPHPCGNPESFVDWFSCTLDYSLISDQIFNFFLNLSPKQMFVWIFVFFYKNVYINNIHKRHVYIYLTVQSVCCVMLRLFNSSSHHSMRYINIEFILCIYSGRLLIPLYKHYNCIGKLVSLDFIPFLLGFSWQLIKLFIWSTFASKHL